MGRRGPATDLRAEPLRRRGEEETIRDLRSEAALRAGGNGLGFGEGARGGGGRRMAYICRRGRPTVGVLVGWAGC
jgi:hypothetical protein